MINGINPNGDITQNEARCTVGLPRSTKINGTNYANRVNNQAKSRLEQYRRSIRVLDELQAITRIKWSNLPVGLTSKLIERILYFKGQGIFYWDSTLEKYFFLPFAMTTEGNESIDFYGRYLAVKPLPFNGRSDNKTKGNQTKSASEVYLGLVKKTPIYDDDSLKETIAAKGKEWVKENCCIICYDYTQQLSQYIEPKSITQECWINSQAEIPLFFRTAIFKALMPKLVKTSDQGTMDAIEAEIQAIEDSILTGKTMIPVTAFQDLQEIDTSSNVDSVVETILKAYDSIDNIRKTQLGIATNGAFKKESGMNPNEQENQNAVNLIIADCLDNRQQFADLVNLAFELSIYPDEGQGLDPEHEDKFEDNEASEMTKLDAGQGGNLSNE